MLNISRSHYFAQPFSAPATILVNFLNKTQLKGAGAENCPCCWRLWSGSLWAQSREGGVWTLIASESSNQTGPLIKCHRAGVCVQTEHRNPTGPNPAEHVRDSRHLLFVMLCPAGLCLILSTQSVFPDLRSYLQITNNLCNIEIHLRGCTPLGKVFTE